MAFWIVYVVAVLFSTSAVHGITSTVNKRNAAIGVSNPLPSKSSGNEGDLKGGESRFSNPEPEYYKYVFEIDYKKETDYLEHVCGDEKMKLKLIGIK